MNKLLNYKPFYFLTFLIVGIILQFYIKVWSYNFNYLFLVTFFFISLLSILKWKQKKVSFTLFSFISFIFIGIITVFINNTSNYKNYYVHIKKDNCSSIIQITKELKSSNYYKKYEANVIQINNEKTCGKIILNLTKDTISDTVSIGQKLITKSIFKKIPQPLNPYTFNYQSYLYKKGILHQVSLNNNEYIFVNDNNYSFKKHLYSFKSKIKNRLQQYNFSKDDLAIINSLLLGERQELSEELLNDYAKAGAIHILAISGLHIGILLLILSQFFSPLNRLKNGLYLKTFFIVIILWLFALFTGFSASVVRATTMFTFIAIGNTFQREKITEYSLITSMLFILLLKPLFLFDVGFQLSYLAVFGIVWTQSLLYKVWKPKHFIIDKAWQLITVSLAAQIGILPISLYYFHQFPGLFLLSNLVIIPVLGIILLGGIVLVLLALLNTLPNFIVTSYSFCIRLINSFIHWISLQEEFLFTNISMSFMKMLSFYLLIICCFQFILKKRIKQLIASLIAIVLVQGVYLYEKKRLETKDEFVVFHKNRNSMIGTKKGEKFNVFENLDGVSLNEKKTINSYLIGNNIKEVSIYKNRPVYQFKKQTVLVIDSLGIYNLKGLENPIIILQNSPKINLERLIKKLKPQQIIADGSNYKNYVYRWEQTCINEKTPFYNTRKNGAYILK